EAKTRELEATLGAAFVVEERLAEVDQRSRHVAFRLRPLGLQIVGVGAVARVALALLGRPARFGDGAPIGSGRRSGRGRILRLRTHLRLTLQREEKEGQQSKSRAQGTSLVFRLACRSGLAPVE